MASTATFTTLIFENEPPSYTDTESISSVLDMLYVRHCSLLRLSPAEFGNLHPLFGLPSWICYGLLEYAITSTPEGDKVDVEKVGQLLDEFIDNGGKSTWSALLYYMWLRVGPIIGEEEGWTSESDDGECLGKAVEAGKIAQCKNVDEKRLLLDPDLTPRPRPRSCPTTTILEAEEASPSPIRKRPNKHNQSSLQSLSSPVYPRMRTSRTEHQRAPIIRPLQLNRQGLRFPHDMGTIVEKIALSGTNIKMKKTNPKTKTIRAFSLFGVSFLVLCIGAVIPWLAIHCTSGFSSTNLDLVGYGITAMKFVQAHLNPIRRGMLELVQGWFKIF